MSGSLGHVQGPPRHSCGQPRRGTCTTEPPGDPSSQQLSPPDGSQHHGAEMSRPAAHPQNARPPSLGKQRGGCFAVLTSVTVRGRWSRACGH